MGASESSLWTDTASGGFWFWFWFTRAISRQGCVGLGGPESHPNRSSSSARSSRAPRVGAGVILMLNYTSQPPARLRSNHSDHPPMGLQLRTRQPITDWESVKQTVLSIFCPVAVRPFGSTAHGPN